MRINSPHIGLDANQSADRIHLSQRNCWKREAERPNGVLRSQREQRLDGGRLREGREQKSGRVPAQNVDRFTQVYRVVIHTNSAADIGLAVVSRGPGITEPRRDIAIQAVSKGRIYAADGSVLESLIKVARSEKQVAVVVTVHSHWIAEIIPTHAQRQQQVRTNFPLVLEEQPFSVSSRAENKWLRRSGQSIVGNSTFTRRRISDEINQIVEIELRAPLRVAEDRGV